MVGSGWFVTSLRSGAGKRSSGGFLLPARSLFPGQLLTDHWAVLDLMIAGARGLGLTAFERQQLAQMRSNRLTLLTEELTA